MKATLALITLSLSAVSAQTVSLATQTLSRCQYGAFGPCSGGFQSTFPTSGDLALCPPKVQPCPTADQCLYTYTTPWSPCINGVTTREYAVLNAGACTPTVAPDSKRPCELCRYMEGPWLCDNGIDSRTITKLNEPCDASNAPATTRTGTCATRTCLYDYKPWGPCTNGVQKREVVQLNSPCTQTDTPVVSIACTEPTCEYSYPTEWSQCVNFVQTRTYKTTNEPCKIATLPLTQQACKSLPICEYVYGEWGPCVNGIRTRSVTKRVEPCDGTTTRPGPPTEQCTALPICEYVYGEWGPCLNGVRTRTVTKKVEPCDGTTTRPLGPTEQCTALPICEYVVGEWGPCLKGTRTRTVTKKVEPCDGTTTRPVGTTEPCIEPVQPMPAPFPPCVYATDAWTECFPNRTMTRNVWETIQPCTPDSKPASSQVCVPPAGPCELVVSDWSACTGGVRTRTVTKKVEPCDATALQAVETKETCVASTLPDCQWKLGEWSDCNKEYKEVRDVVQTNAPCNEVQRPPAEQPCYLPACIYKTGAWSICTNGLQKRDVVEANAPCAEDNAPAGEQKCGPEPCSYQMGDWTECNATSGTRTRKVVTTVTPCVPSSTPPLAESKCDLPECTYTTGDWQPCDPATKTQSRTVTATVAKCRQASAPPAASKTCDSSTCTYTYGDWQPCVNGMRERVATFANYPCTVTDPPRARSMCNETCQYTYGDWTKCTDGWENRTAKEVITPCTKTTAPIVKRECNSNAECMYGEWSPCVNGTQTQKWIGGTGGSYPAQFLTTAKFAAGSLPSQCKGEITRPCTLPPCTYTYADWGICTNGKQSRTYTVGGGCEQTPAPITDRNCGEALPACQYIFSPWAPCTNGQQTRTYQVADAITGAASGAAISTVDVPTGTRCSQTTKPLLSQPCTTTPDTACYTYSDWSVCSPLGVQTRVIVQKPPVLSPTCVELLQQQCTPSCTYDYTDWTACNVNGTQARQARFVKYPCAVTTPPEAMRKCQLPACIYTLGLPGACQLNGTRTRPVTTANAPCNSTGVAQPSTMEKCTPRTCTFTAGEWTACTTALVQTRNITEANSPCIGGTKPPTSQPCKLPTCLYSISSYGTCTNGKQTRSAIKANEPCTGGTLPVLERDCSAPPCEYSTGPWSECVAQKKTRVVTKKTTPCTATNEPVAQMACDSAPACEYKYEAWSPCTDGKQKRVSSFVVFPCDVVTPAVVEQPCSGNCEYVYTNWTDCVNGQQSRRATNKVSPCVTVTQPFILRKCDSPPAGCEYGPWSPCQVDSQSQILIKPSPTPGVNCPQVATRGCQLPACEYEYGTWSTCAAGKMTRNFTFKPPAGLDVAPKPVPVAARSAHAQQTTAMPGAPSFCNMAPAPELVKNCGTALPPCDYVTSDWTACKDGKQTRTATAKTLTGCSPAPPAIEQKCAAEPCDYIYTEWTKCANGRQTRAITQSPSGASCPPAGALEQTCLVECEYFYGDWSPCKDGEQTRLGGAMNQPCDMAKGPIVTQRCLSGPLCEYEYGPWMPDTCTEGIQTRFSTQKPAPAGGCTPIAPVSVKDCGKPTPLPDLPPCPYKYSEWTVCVMGKQSRKAELVAGNAGMCKEGSEPLDRTCTDMPTMPIVPASPSNPCPYTYGEWSACVNGQQTRKATPIPTLVACDGKPITTQMCTSPQPVPLSPPPVLPPVAPPVAPPVPPPACVYTYGNWTKCAMGQRTRTFTAAPTAAAVPCEGKPIIMETCDVLCEYTYTAWGECLANSQTRVSTIANSPCKQAEPPVVTQACVSPPRPAECPATAPSDTIWGTWGVCTAGKMTRRGTLPAWYPVAATCPPYVASSACLAPIQQIDEEHHGVKSDTKGVATGSILSTVPDTERAQLWVASVNTNVLLGKNFVGEKAVGGMYGTLLMKVDGTWTYKVNYAEPTVAAFGDLKDVLSDSFGVTMEHSDGTKRNVVVVVGVWHFY